MALSQFSALADILYRHLSVETLAKFLIFGIFASIHSFIGLRFQVSGLSNPMFNT